MNIIGHRINVILQKRKLKLREVMGSLTLHQKLAEGLDLGHLNFGGLNSNRLEMWQWVRGH